MLRACLVGLGTLVLTVALLVPNLAMADSVYGAVILNEAHKIAPGRYQSHKSYEDTMRFFHRAYGSTDGVVIRRIEGTPKVKGVHIANIAARRTWDGINVYETGNKVFIYVLKAGSSGADKK